MPVRGEADGVWQEGGLTRSDVIRPFSVPPPRFLLETPNLSTPGFQETTHGIPQGNRLHPCVGGGSSASGASSPTTPSPGAQSLLLLSFPGYAETRGPPGTEPRRGCRTHQLGEAAFGVQLPGDPRGNPSHVPGSSYFSAPPAGRVELGSGSGPRCQGCAPGRSRLCAPGVCTAVFRGFVAGTRRPSRLRAVSLADRGLGSPAGRAFGPTGGPKRKAEGRPSQVRLQTQGASRHALGTSPGPKSSAQAGPGSPGLRPARKLLFAEPSVWFQSTEVEPGLALCKAARSVGSLAAAARPAEQGLRRLCAEARQGAQTLGMWAVL